MKQNTRTLIMFRAREAPCLSNRFKLPMGYFINIRSRLIWSSSSGNLSDLTDSQETITVFSGRRNIIYINQHKHEEMHKRLEY